MLTKRFLLICSLPSFLAGCAGFYDGQAPAPVYQGGSPVYRQPPAYPPSREEPITVIQEPEIVKTKPLGVNTPPLTAPIEIPPEPLPPEQDLFPDQDAAETSPDEPAAQPNPQQGQPEPAPSLPPPPMEFAPLESFAPLSPAVGALMISANKNSQTGDIESATTTIERAIRIEPRNATLYYKLAVLRLSQSKPRLAEDLAKKSASLATRDNQLKKHSWLLIAKAREMQKNYQGAKEAKAKADKFQ